MMRRAYFGTNALILLGFHAVLIVLDLAGVVPYLKTMFFPMLSCIALMLSVLGWVERDKMKAPAVVATLLWAGGLVFWVVALIVRMRGM